MSEAVIAQLRADMADSDISFIPPQKTAIQTDNLNAVLLEKEYKKLERVKEAYEAGIDPIEEYKMNKLRIQSRITELEAAAAQPSRDETAAGFGMKSGAVMDKLMSADISENEKNAMLRELISHITFDRRNMTIRIVYLPTI
jgi:hypothetical protein